MSPEKKFACICLGILTLAVVIQITNSEKRMKTLFEETLKDIQADRTNKPKLTLVEDKKDV